MMKKYYIVVIASFALALNVARGALFLGTTDSRQTGSAYVYVVNYSAYHIKVSVPFVYSGSVLWYMGFYPEDLVSKEVSAGLIEDPTVATIRSSSTIYKGGGPGLPIIFENMGMSLKKGEEGKAVLNLSEKENDRLAKLRGKQLGETLRKLEKDLKAQETLLSQVDDSLDTNSDSLSNVSTFRKAIAVMEEAIVQTKKEISDLEALERKVKVSEIYAKAVNEGRTNIANLNAYKGKQARFDMGGSGDPEDQVFYDAGIVVRASWMKAGEVEGIDHDGWAFTIDNIEEDLEEPVELYNYNF